MVDLEIIENLIKEILEPLNWTIVFIIIGGGIYLTIISRANPLFRIISGFKLMLKKDQSSVGISRFQALSAVLAATVGLGNISGVALAIHQGGPGVLFWMWITALFGAIIKFFSCSLAISLRDKDEKGNYLAGPMYYMKSGIKKWGRTLAIWFSIAGLVGVLPAFTANQLTQSYITVLDPDAIYALGDTNWKLIIGIIFARFFSSRLTVANSLTKSCALYAIPSPQISNNFKSFAPSTITTISSFF